MSEQQEDVIEESSDLTEELIIDETAEPSTALDTEQVSEEPEDETIKVFESDKANQRFSQITTETKEAKAEAAASRAENEALRRRIEAIESTALPEYVDPGAPNLQDFDYDTDAHQAASIAYETTKATHNVLAQQRVATKQASEAANQQALFGDHNQKRTALALTVKDLNETLNASQLNNQTQGGNATAEAILRSENGAEIEYHIAKNPEIAVRLNNMDQFTAFGEVARIAESLKVKPKKSAALPEPVGASPSGGGQTSEFKAVYSAGATYE